MDSDFAIRLAGVSVSRRAALAPAGGARRVLRDVSLSVSPGEVVALVGRSGSGKTTLLRLINRLLDPDSGSVMVQGRDTRAWDPIALRRGIGYVIQDAGLFPHMTVGSNIAVVPRLLAWPESRVALRVDELLTMIGLDPSIYRERWPDQLSGGERQRVGLARALAVDPPLLLMDEPFGALDPITKRELHAEFARVQASLRRSVVLVTHDMDEAFALADRIAVLHDGEIAMCDAPEAVAASRDPRVTALIGERSASPRPHRGEAG